MIQIQWRELPISEPSLYVLFWRLALEMEKPDAWSKAILRSYSTEHRRLKGEYPHELTLSCFMKYQSNGKFSALIAIVPLDLTCDYCENKRILGWRVVIPCDEIIPSTWRISARQTVQSPSSFPNTPIMPVHSVFKPGNTALISGAASGVGLAVAKLCHKRGMGVALVDRNTEALSQASSAFKDGKAQTYVMDVSKIDEWHDLRVKVEMDFGQVNFLMLNAGIGLKSGWEDVDYFHKVLLLISSLIFLSHTH